MSVALRHVQRLCKLPTGGHRPTVSLIIPADVQQPDFGDGPALGSATEDAPTLNTGTTAYTFEPDYNTLQFNEQELISRHGERYRQTITFRYSPMTPELADARRRLRHRRRVHVLITDRANKLTRIITLATAKLDNTTGPQRGDRNQATWTLSSESKYPASYLDTELSVSTTTNDNIILEHIASGTHWLVTVDANGSLITTPVLNGGVPQIPINNIYSLQIFNNVGSLGTNPQMGLHQQLRNVTTTELNDLVANGGLIAGFEYFDTDQQKKYFALDSTTLSLPQGEASGTAVAKTLYRQVFPVDSGATITVTVSPTTLPASNAEIYMYTSRGRLMDGFDWTRTETQGNALFNLTPPREDEWIVIEWQA